MTTPEDPPATRERLVRVLARALDVPFALHLRIEGGRVELVASAGIDAEALGRAGLRFEDFATDDAGLVTDLTVDPRFSGGAWATVAPGARALARAAVRDGAGRRLGLLAAIDTRPRAWTSREAELLAELAGLALDITERDAPQAALRASEERHRILFEKAGEGIFFIQAEGERAGVIVDANAAAAAMYGYTQDEMRGLRVSDIVGPEGSARVASNLARALAGEWLEIESVDVKKDGTRFHVDGVIGPLDSGGQRFILGFLRDVTERRRADEALRDAKDAAEAANRAKSSFLANMSHEIRTPMNAILGYTQLLQRDPQMGSEQRQALQIIGRSGDHLLALINDVLEMSKIEAGHRKLARATVDLHGVIDDLERMFRLRADAAQLSFEISRAPSVPRYITGDEGKLRQILVNLLGNAVKFTEQGGVTGVVRGLATDAGELQLSVSIEDTGPGMTPEELAGLFQPFAQARLGIGARGGTGLGLAISREFARLMGGDITVESRPRKGSVFRLEIPVELAPPPSARAAPIAGQVAGLADAGPPPRILVVDDCEDNRTWQVRLLQQVGFEVREAADGAEALAAFQAWQPRLVLMDMNMPVMDGYAATRAIRALALADPVAVAVVAVTAVAFDDARDAIFASGVDGWLRKPCREAELLEEIRRHLGVRYHYAAQMPRTPTPLRFHAVRPATQLSTALYTGLHRAAHIADYQRLGELIKEMPPEHARIAEELERLVDAYAYDTIELVLQAYMAAV